MVSLRHPLPLSSSRSCCCPGQESGDTRGPVWDRCGQKGRAGTQGGRNLYLFFSPFNLITFVFVLSVYGDGGVYRRQLGGVLGLELKSKLTGALTIEWPVTQPPLILIRGTQRGSGNIRKRSMPLSKLGVLDLPGLAFCNNNKNNSVGVCDTQGCVLPALKESHFALKSRGQRQPCR